MFAQITSAMLRKPASMVANRVLKILLFVIMIPPNKFVIVY